jgi:hypothetical protein
MGFIEFGEPGQSGEFESLEARRHQLASAYQELRSIVGDLISSGAANDGRTKTPELLEAEQISEQLKGEPIRGILHGTRYYVDDLPPGYLSAPHYLPHGFKSPTVLGIFEGAIKMHKVQENAELCIGVSPFAISENEDITAHYEKNGQARVRWNQPLGLREQDLDKRLWLPAEKFEFILSDPADDYLGKAMGNAEGLRAYFRHRFPPEQPEAE